MLKLDHVSLYVRDLARSRAFYEQVLVPFGMRIVKDLGEVAVGFGYRDYAIVALVLTTVERVPTHVAFRVASRTEVARFHELALAAGAVDNGAPGRRPEYHGNYYAAFVTDPDGHNIEFVCHREDPRGD